MERRKGGLYFSRFYVAASLCLFCILFRASNYGKDTVYRAYTVCAYEHDPDGLLDYVETRYLQTGEDPYEEDDDAQHATPLLINAPSNKSQLHNFHAPDDDDWITFYAHGGRRYELHIARCSDEGNCDFPWLNAGCPLVASFFFVDSNNVVHPALNCSAQPLQLAPYQYPNFDPDDDPEGQSFCLVETGFYCIRFTYGCDQSIHNTPAYYELVEITDNTAGPKTGNISGGVLYGEHGLGLAAEVFATLRDGTTERTNSDMNGRFLFLNLREGAYQLYAAVCGYRSDTYDVTVEAQSLSKLNLFMSPAPNDPKCVSSSNIAGKREKSQEFYRIVNDSYANNTKRWIALYPGMNLFSPPCKISGYDSKCLLDELCQMISEYYAGKDLPFYRFRAAIRRYDSSGSDPSHLTGCFIDNSKRVQGDTFALYPYESYIVSIGIEDPNQNLRKIQVQFDCSENNSATGVYNFKEGINFVGFSDFPSGYTAHDLFKDRDLQNSLKGMFSYDHQRGIFRPLYKMFGKWAGHSAAMTDEHGYILIMQEKLDGWMFE
ncbi:MAG: carboxypeptidase-like regulatory domain-containing protein [bacterium]